jgi:protein involved in polysaccharide export with SLBB domain
MLAQAGGPLEEAGDELLLIQGQPPARLIAEYGGADAVAADMAADVLGRPSSEVMTIDLRELVDAGKLALNVCVRGGDVIAVPPRAADYVYVLGYVRRPGAYELGAGNRLDALRAVALGGGLMSSARAENSHLIRETTAGQKAISVNLTKLAKGEVPPLYLEPGDTLVVGTSFMGRVSEVLAPSLGANISASAAVGQ